MTNLFRKEAISFASRRLSGEVVLASSLSARTVTVVLSCAVAGGLLFAATSSYARKESVPGWLTPEAGIIRVSALRGGVVDRLHVAEGDWVVEGQPIATLSLTSNVQAGDSFEALSRGLEAQRSAETHQAEAAIATLAAEQRQLERRRSALGRELAEVRRRAGLQQQQVELSRAEVARSEQITEQGFMPRRELDSRKAAALSAEQSASELASQVLTLERETAEIDERLAVIPIDLSAASARSAAVLANLQQTATRTESEQRYVVTASGSGRMAILPVRPGQSVEAGAPVAIVTPADDTLEAEIYVPPRASGFIRAGQEVRLQYAAFPHQKFGTGQGRVISVSDAIVTDRDVQVPGLTLEEPSFRVKVALESTEVRAYRETIALRPGMLLQADVIIDRRSLLEWLLDPIYAAGRRQ